MKLILILLLVAIITINAKLSRTTRTLGPENVQLQFEYLGSCADFNANDSSTVKISSSSGLCLPITLDGGLDTDNYQADYFCSDIGYKRSIIHFVEVFLDVETNIMQNYVVSFIPTAPFRAYDPHSTLHYYRRPSCDKYSEFCTPSNSHVKSCTANTVTIQKKKYVVNRDRIYIGVNVVLGNTCQDTGSVCCSYVEVLGTGSGICPNVASTVLNPFPRKHQRPTKRPTYAPVESESESETETENTTSNENTSSNDPETENDK